MFKKGSFEIGGDIYPVAIKARLLIIFNYFAFPSVTLKLKFTPSHSEISSQNKGWASLISMFLRESLGVPSGWGKEESLEPWNPNIIAWSSELEEVHEDTAGSVPRAPVQRDRTKR